MKKIVLSATMAFAFTFGAGIINNADAQTTDKKWSNKKKYTAIGTGVGVGTGVIVGKNDSKSAVIGGVIGAGSGYLYGRHKDTKKAKQ